MSGWFLRARADGGLVIPGGPWGHTADVVLTTRGLDLRVGPLVAALEWELAASQSVLDRAPGDWDRSWGDLWWFTSGGSGGVGVGVRVDGALIERTREVRSRTRSLWNVLNGWSVEGVVVPCWSVAHRGPAVDADLATIRALCAVLRDRSELRERLADPVRLDHLAFDLRNVRRRRVPPRTGVRRTTFEILAALRSLGYLHRYENRPLPGEPLPEPDLVVAAVVARLRANPFCADLDISEAQVSETVRRHYLDVEPWPFDALVD